MNTDIARKHSRTMRAVKGPYLHPGTPCRPGSRKPAAEPKPKKRVDYQRTAIVKARTAGVMCRHCTKSLVNRPRGLCWTCYYKPGVTELYPSTSKYARRGTGNFSGEAPLAPEPTTAVPGTPEKLLVMEERAKLRQAIFHPLDRYSGENDEQQRERVARSLPESSSEEIDRLLGAPGSGQREGLQGSAHGRAA